MYDIFLSYATEDRQRLKPLVTAFQQKGWKVFWDHESVRIGSDWRQIIADALANSHSVVVVWTEYSIARDFVLEEATEAKERGVLLPILWDHVRPPFGFRLYQAADFSVWDQNLTHPVFQKLAHEIRNFTSSNAATQISQTKRIQPVAHLPFEIEMVVVPAGSFTMGWLDERDGEGSDREMPAHTVTLKRFEIGKYPVTQAQWQAVVGENPSHFQVGGENCPVEYVSWDDIQIFILKLTFLTGKTYRLPSEAEWEYACRAGKSRTFWGGYDVNAVAWYGNNSGNRTHPVGGKKGNAWGLHDMIGNVWEWVQDGNHSDYNGAPSDGSAWEGGMDEYCAAVLGAAKTSTPRLPAERSSCPRLGISTSVLGLPERSHSDSVD